MWVLIVVVLPSLVTACIPMKHIEPGIPAKPPSPPAPPNMCKKLGAMNVNTCKTAAVSGGKTCDYAAFSTTATVCAAPNTKYILGGLSSPNAAISAMMVVCEKDMTWSFDGVPQATIQAQVGGTGIVVACTIP